MKRLILTGISLFAAGLACDGAAPVKPAVEPFQLKHVRLLESPFRHAMEVNQKYLLELDSDRMLHMFRVTAGLPSTAVPLGGWEAPNIEIRGHSMGHYLSGLAFAYAATGDAQFKAKAEHLVAELAKVQQAMPARGFNAGYLCAFPESFFDRVDNAQPVWVPWYTCHKIMAGLIDVHEHCGNPQALAVLNLMRQWIKFRTDRLSEEQMQVSLNLEFGGMGESLANLHAITGNPEDLLLARRFDKKSFTGPLAAGVDNLRGLHSNTHIPQVIACARLYELTDERPFRAATEFFWKCVVPGRIFAIGGTSNYEHWRTPAGQVSTERSVESQESCCTYNMLKLARHLFTWNAEPGYIEYVERAIYNGILATIDPGSGMTMYYVALKPGHFKVLGTPTQSFWCCTGTGMENHSKYGGEIYYHSADNLYVNLFIPSELDWTGKGVKVRLDTRFPESDQVNLVLTAPAPARFALHLRVPGWAGNGIAVKVNGKTQEVAAMPGRYLILDRTWTNGDSVEFTVPMGLRLEPTPDDPSVVAVCYGPVVLAGKLGDTNYVKTVEQAPDQRQRHGAPGIEVPDIVTKESVDNWLKPVRDQSLTWRTAGAGRPADLTLIPFYKLFGERYNIYWKIHTPETYAAMDAKRQARERELEELEARIIDAVQIGSAESETKHALKTEKSRTGLHEGRQWRDAEPGGWFSWDFKVEPDKPQAVRCEYWGLDTGRATEIKVDGVMIAREELRGESGSAFFSREYPIPANLVKGKDKISVRFESSAGTVVGGIFGAAIVSGK